MNANVYWRVSAWALAAAAVLGMGLNAVYGSGAWLISEGFLTFDWSHNILHAILAGAAFTFGYGPVGATTGKRFAVVFGVIYGGLGVVGLLLGTLSLPFGLHVELGENLIHLTLGAWGLLAGLMPSA